MLWAEPTRRAWNARFDRLFAYLVELQASASASPSSNDTNLCETPAPENDEADHITKWFSPAGFTTTSLEVDIRVGDRYRFVYVGPDGTRWDDRMELLEILPNERIVFDHGSDLDDDPTRFRTTITFVSRPDGKTVLTLPQLHPTREQRNAGIGFGAVAIGYTTLDALDRYAVTVSAAAQA